MKCQGEARRLPARPGLHCLRRRSAPHRVDHRSGHRDPRLLFRWAFATFFTRSGGQGALQPCFDQASSTSSRGSGRVAKAVLVGPCIRDAHAPELSRLFARIASNDERSGSVAERESATTFGLMSCLLAERAPVPVPTVGAPRGLLIAHGHAKARGCSGRGIDLMAAASSRRSASGDGRRAKTAAGPSALSLGHWSASAVDTRPTPRRNDSRRASTAAFNGSSPAPTAT